MSAIDKVKAHYSKKEVRKLDVPEWDMIVYTTALTIADKDRIWAKTRKKESTDFVLLVYAVIDKATDEKGKALFTLEDKHTLMTQADSDVVARIGNWILQSDWEDAEKNS